MAGSRSPASRVLAIAVGNTRVSFLALHRNTYGTPCLSIPTGNTRSFAAAWPKILHHMNGVPDDVLLGGVVPAVLNRLERDLRERGIQKLHRFRRNLPCPLQIRPKPAARVGDDRLAAALGALSLNAAHPWVIVDCGTALTVNGVRPAKGKYVGVFEGGLIMPGEALALRSLNAGTAQLPKFDPIRPGALGPALGTSTRDAMRAGVRRMQHAAIVHAVRAQAKELGPRTRVVLTGGGAPFLWKPLFSELRALRPDYLSELVLLGLFAAWEHENRTR